MSRFEVIVDEELVKDIGAPGKVFRKGLSDVVNLQTEDHGQMLSVDLEKLEDNVIKLFITVYKKTVADVTSHQSSEDGNSECAQRSSVGNTSVDKQASISHTADGSASVHVATTSQTDVTNFDNCSTQTNSSEWHHMAVTQTENLQILRAGTSQTDNSHLQQDNLSQTNHSEWLISVECQTDESRVRQSFVDVGSETSANLASQISSHVQASVDSLDGQCQTSVSAVDVTVQASVSVANANVETDQHTYTEFCSQTDLSVAWRAESSVQATVAQADSAIQSVPSAVASDSQTDLSIAWRSDSETQVSVEVVDGIVQAVASVAPADSQTDISRALQSECATQFTVETAESAAQAVSVTNPVDCQTELSLAWRSDSETQVSVETSECPVQAAVETLVNDCQTTSSMSLELNCGVQACVELLEATSQTTDCVSAAASSQTEAATHLEAEQHLDGSSDVMKVANASGATAPSALPSQVLLPVGDSFDASLLSQSFADASFATAIDRNPVIDGSSQTDPVTIIIGDASFLVKKLKSSAVSPSKVTTCGNEIEIEVNPDTELELPKMAMPPSDEKENNQLNRPHVILPATTTSSPSTGSGVMMRGSPGLGPRMRLPVATVGQQQVVMATRTPGGLLVRQPVMQGMAGVSPVVTTANVVTGIIAGPQPITGTGGVSCPFCSLRFIDSPALYEHLSLQHAVDQKTAWRQPKGRHGKTIVPQKRTQPTGGAGDSSSSPVSTHTDSCNISAAGVRYRAPVPSQPSPAAAAAVSSVNNAAGKKVVSDKEAELFEDPVEPKSVKKPRGRPSKTGSTPSAGDANADNSTPPVKRMRTASDVDVGVDAGLSEAQADAADNDTPRTGGRRGGRTPRGGKRK